MGGQCGGYSKKESMGMAGMAYYGSSGTFQEPVFSTSHVPIKEVDIYPSNRSSNRDGGAFKSP